MTNPGHFRRIECYSDIVADGLLVGSFERPLLLNGTGRRIWEALEYASRIDTLCDGLQVDFDVMPEARREDVAVFVGELVDAGLVEQSSSPDPMRDRYLALLKRSLANMLYAENEQRLWLLFDKDGQPPADWPDHEHLRDIRYREPDAFEALMVAKRAGHVVHRQPGRYAHTMVGLHGLTHIERLAERLFADQVPGDFVDAGIWRGGCGILMRALQHAFGEGHRRLWAADSFCGVPPSASEPDLRSGLNLTEARYPWMSASLRAVRDNFADHGLLDDGVRFLPGLFADTLPGSPIERIALLRVDGDLYESTMDCLEALYDRVSDGGFVIVDDYGAFEPCREAVDAFRARRGITDPLVRANWTVVHWRKYG